ncbi:ABC transporter substrate-binding protein [Paenibacillus helianthi]|uniref:Maltodextrin-binding protein n=1 Tax=Paenibacillus helianthi TaxID=1349432 RepID=A0ABX3EQJ8_9BACL|nr:MULTISPECIES: maltose ABC transporter substrate-binding protein [Paenibacillus]OKP73735.1 ABC transporter substrate-binding protein [Paenibacillus sp. P3E]OKP87657.1 ABC transporter substrate-binding protein [Paenibacillus helianthi]OKP93321.1 ABC transporter substrate-binding protein [Paenibacillus sp. P32E]
MEMKKLMVLTAAFSMAVSITACGSNNNGNNGGNAAASNAPTDNATATNAATNSGNAAATGEIAPEDGASLLVWESKEERPFAEEIAKQFTAKYNVPVKIEEIAPPDQVGKLTQDGPSGLAADVVLIPHDNLGKAVSASLLLPNDIFTEQTKADNTEASIIGSSFDGELYGYPRAAETYALYYNKSLVKEAPKSFDDVIAFSKTFTDKAKSKYGIMWEVGNMYFGYPFIATTGGYLFGKDGTDKDDIGLNNEGAIEGLKTFVKLKEALPVKSGDITADIKRSLFSSGDVAMDMTGPWELAAYKEALGDKLGVAPIPTIDGKTAISFSGIKIFGVNAYSKYPNAAKLYAHFASSKDAQLLLNKLIGSIPTNNEALKDAQITGDPYISAFAEQAKNSQPMPSIPEMGNVWSPVNAALPEIWDNNADPKAAMDKAVQQIKDLNNGSTSK